MARVITKIGGAEIMLRGKLGNQVFQVRNGKQIVINKPRQRSTPPSDKEIERRRGACERLWHGYDVARQEAIYMQIKRKLERGEFVHENPYFAIEDNARHLCRSQQTLTFKEYYARFGTTAEQDGWRMINPTGQQVIYVKN